MFAYFVEKKLEHSSKIGLCLNYFRESNEPKKEHQFKTTTYKHMNRLASAPKDMRRLTPISLTKTLFNQKKVEKFKFIY